MKPKSRSSSPPPAKSGRIPARTGIITMAILSLLLGFWTGYQVSVGFGLLQGVIYGVAFAAGIWVVFFIAYFFTRWLHRH